MQQDIRDHVLYGDLTKFYPMAEKGEGVYIWDAKGVKYLDAVGGAAVVSIGHGVAEILQVMTQQARKICFAHRSQFTSEAKINCAQKIIDFAPEGMSKVLFVQSGSEASEAALKMARQYHLERGNPSKYKVIARWQSYHGNTIGALSMSGRPSWRKNWIPYLLNFPHVVPPYCYRCSFNLSYPQCGVQCAYELERTIKLEGSETISAFIAEPIIGTTATGVVPPPEYFKIIRSICDRYEVIMIADEIITGLGRTGRNFGIDHFGVVPDIIATGKGLTSGYLPLAAVISHEKIVDTILQGTGEFPHGHTYSGHPLSCAIAFAVLDYIEKNKLIERVARMEKILFEGLSELEDLPIVGDIRGKGLLAGIEFVADKEKKTPFQREKEVAQGIARRAFEKGLIIIPGIPGNVDGVLGDHIQITPPFIISESEIGKTVDVLKEVLRETHKIL